MIYDQIAQIIHNLENLNEIEESYEADSTDEWSDDDPFSNPYAGTDEPSPADENTEDDMEQADGMKDRILNEFNNALALDAKLNNSQIVNLKDAKKLFLNGDYERYSNCYTDLSNILPTDYKSPIQKILEKRMQNIKNLKHKLTIKNVNQIAAKLYHLKSQALIYALHHDPVDIETNPLEIIELKDANIYTNHQVIDRLKDNLINDYHPHMKEAKQKVNRELTKLNQEKKLHFYYLGDTLLDVHPLTARRLMKYLKQDYADIKDEADCEHNFLLGIDD